MLKLKIEGSRDSGCPKSELVECLVQEDAVWESFENNRYRGV